MVTRFELQLHPVGPEITAGLPQSESERTADAYGENLERLARIQSTYDPDKLLRTNQNIRPARPNQTPASVS